MSSTTTPNAPHRPPVPTSCDALADSDALGIGDRDDELDDEAEDFAESLSSSTSASTSSSSCPDASSVVRGRRVRNSRITRAVSVIVANLSTLCAGSILVFSLYAPTFQSRLHYTQFQVNGVAITGSLSLYLPVSVMGYTCDRVGVRPLSILSAGLFGAGYGLAAVVYRKVDHAYNTLHRPYGSEDGWSYPLMILAFALVGVGTCAMYMSCVSTCAKNFGKSRHRGLALALPITGFGLSGMWLSQFGSKVLYERRPDGSKGDVDVFRFFVFLAILLFVMGVIGTFTLRVVDEQDLIEEVIEDLEHSGLLDRRSLLSRSDRGYGTAGSVVQTVESDDSGSLESAKNTSARWRKNWVLNAETRRFLSDYTMWPFALAFLLMIGPGEAFINNLGTVLRSLTPPVEGLTPTSSSPATHVSVFGITNTVARLLMGSLTDLVAPSPETQHLQIAAPHERSRASSARFSISRVSFMLLFAGVLSVGLLYLASGSVQGHADRFWVVSGLVGAGYGAIFSLMPLMVTMIWGVENFATNFSILGMLPAVGSMFWGLVYSAEYQSGARAPSSPAQDGVGPDSRDIFCYGTQCYRSTFLAQGITVWLACFLLLWAWKGKGGWQKMGVIV